MRFANSFALMTNIHTSLCIIFVLPYLKLSLLHLTINCSFFFSTNILRIISIEYCFRDIYDCT